MWNIFRKPIKVTAESTFFLGHVQEALTLLKYSYYNGRKGKVAIVDFTLKFLKSLRAVEGVVEVTSVTGHFTVNGGLYKFRAEVGTRSYNDGRPMHLDYYHPHTIYVTDQGPYRVKWTPSGECLAQWQYKDPNKDRWLSSYDLLTLDELPLGDRPNTVLYTHRMRNLGHMKVWADNYIRGERDELSEDISIVGAIKNCLAQFGHSMPD